MRRICLCLLVVACLFVRPGGTAQSFSEGTLSSAVSHSAGEDVQSLPLPRFPGCGGVIVPVANTVYEQQVVEMVNQERAQEGLPPLKRNTNLDNAARFHATDMAQDHYFHHDSYNVNSVFVCLWWQRVQGYYPNYSWLGENIAAGYTNPQEVMTGWMASSGHRQNILSADFWEIGVGYAVADSHWWVQDFGQDWSRFPLVIDREAAFTDDRQVDIYLYGDWNEMRLKNDSEPFGPWQPFQNNLSWTLGHGNGVHTVTAEMRNAQTTVASSDTIELSGMPELGGVASSLVFLYSQSAAYLEPASVSFFPADVGTGSSFDWTVDVNEPWLVVTPDSGSEGEMFTVTIQDTASMPLGLYQTTMTFTTTPVLDGSPMVIPVTLVVCPSTIQHIYLPVVRR